MARFKNIEWSFNSTADGHIQTWQQAEVAVLMDIRDELQALNAKLLGVGPTVHDIERNTRGIRRCKRCGRGPYLTVRGLERHVEREHIKARRE